MQLQEALERMHPNRMVYIGCRHGSGFFEIDYARNINLDELNVRFYASLTNEIARLADVIDDYPENLRKLEMEAESIANQLPKLEENKLKYMRQAAELMHSDPEDEKAMQKLCAAQSMVRKAEKDIDLLPGKVERAQAKVNQFSAKILVTKEKLNTLKEKQSVWKPLKDRQVIKAYAHTVDIIGQTFIVEGDLEGMMWFYHDKKGTRHGKGRYGKQRSDLW